MRFTRGRISSVIGIGAAALLLATYGFARQSPTTQQSPPKASTSHSAATTRHATPSKSTEAKSSELTTDKQKESYALGMNIAARLKEQPVDLDKDALVLGFKDELSGGKTQLTSDQAQAALKQLSDEANAKAQAQQQKAAEANMKEGQDFLAANKVKDGVVVLPSGLQYKIETKGTGPKPTASDTVTCNYRGTFINGQEFDSSAKHGQAATFPVSGVIKGWTEALQLMPVGSKWQLFIPADLAYGTRGAGGVIGPNQTLIFEVELLSIKAK